MTYKPKNKVNLSEVKPEDRVYVKNIINGVLAYDEITVELDVKIFPTTTDHYNIAFLKWTDEIDDQRWFETFLKTSGHDKRENKYDYVISTATIPCPIITTTKNEEQVNTGPIKLFRIAKGAFNTSKQNKQRK